MKSSINEYSAEIVVLNLRGSITVAGVELDPEFGIFLGSRSGARVKILPENRSKIRVQILTYVLFIK